MVYLKRRFLSFWARYNYVVSAAFSCGIAISAVIQFFGLQMPEVSFDWVSPLIVSNAMNGAQTADACSGATKCCMRVAKGWLAG